MDEAAPNPNCPGCKALLDRVAHLAREVERLTALVQELRERLDQNSSNSSRPPSADAPGQRAGRKRRGRSGKKRGGQPGHQACQRTPVPAELVTRHERHDPRRCRGCGESLTKAEVLEPLRHQVVEIPQIEPEVTEYLLGRRRCTSCRKVTAAQLPPGTPTGMCGPRLMALIALLTGGYHLSRRNTVGLLHDVLGIRLSLGTVSNVEGRVSDVLAPAHAEALERVRQAKVKNLDATSWAQAGEPRSLWTFASRLATVFVITVGAGSAVVRELVGTVLGTLVTDRGSQFGFWAMTRRQICWAHLIRKFVAFAQSARPEVQQLGESLLLLSQAHLGYWHRVRDGTQTRRDHQALVARLEPIFLGHLEHGVGLHLRGVSGACKNLLAHKDALFTYAFVEGVPPTNNHAERELRGFVLWRRQTFGTRSDRGDRYAERVMTVVHTLRKQGRHVLSYLETACANSLRGESIPALTRSTP